MSRELIARSPDLHRLDEEGFVLEVRDGHLVVRDIPYVDSTRSIRSGALVAPLNLAGDQTTSPTDHTMLFVGDFPCDANGTELKKMQCQEKNLDLGDGINVRHMFSRKPSGDAYKDYHLMVRQYAQEIGRHAKDIDPNITARTRRFVEGQDDDVFRYADTASSLSGTTDLSHRLSNDVLAIVGLGGTGSYVLDLVSKTWVREIHLYDHDEFLQKNAFRAPGAPTQATLLDRPKKVDYFKNVYNKMRSGIVAHDCRVDKSNVKELTRMTFVFICIDEAPDKDVIIQELENANVDFIDVGLGVSRHEGKLNGLVRTTTSSADTRTDARSQIRGMKQRTRDEYDQPNIQIAELNSLNASLAVIRWKKLKDIYCSSNQEYNSVYAIEKNRIINDSMTDDD